jgi:glycosyltransferase involved in cell wall biosynthesis
MCNSIYTCHVNIVFDNQIFSRQKYGGISRYFVELANELNEYSTDSKVQVVAPFHFNKLLSQSRNISPHSHYIPWSTQTFGWNKKISSLSTALAFRKITQIQPNLIHETFFSAEDLWKSSSPRVLTIYDLIREKEGLRNVNPQIQRKRVAIGRVDSIICISEKTKKDLLDIYNVEDTKVKVVHLGVSEMFLPSKIDAKRKREILFVGQRLGYKNFSLLVRAFATSRLPREGFVLRLFGGDELSIEEKALFTQLNLTPEQVLRSDGDDKMLRKAYGDASALVVPSLDEGFGLPILEAMCSGLPVLCSDIEVFKEFAGTEVSYFHPLDVKDLATKLDGLLDIDHNDVLLSNRRINQARKFTWRKCAFETLSIYKNLVKN